MRITGYTNSIIIYTEEFVSQRWKKNFAPEKSHYRKEYYAKT